MLNYEELRQRFDEDILQSNYSDEAIDAVSELLEMINDGYLKTSDEVYDTVWEVLDGSFIYYYEAWDYMKHWGDNDLSGYVTEGFHTITQMAAKVCEEQIWEILNDLGI